MDRLQFVVTDDATGKVAIVYVGSSGELAEQAYEKACANESIQSVRLFASPIHNRVFNPAESAAHEKAELKKHADAKKAEAGRERAQAEKQLKDAEAATKAAKATLEKLDGKK